MTNNSHERLALTEGQSQKNIARNTKTFSQHGYSASLTANSDLEIDASYRLEIQSTDLDLTIRDIYNVKRVKELLELYNISPDNISIISGEKWRQEGLIPSIVESITLRLYLNIDKDIFKDQFETRVYYISVDGTLACGNIIHGTHSKSIVPVTGQNLAVRIYSDSLEKKYSLDELIELINLNAEILSFEIKQGNPHRKEGLPYKPDLYTYILHMKKI